MMVGFLRIDMRKEQATPKNSMKVNVVLCIGCMHLILR